MINLKVCNNMPCSNSLDIYYEGLNNVINNNEQNLAELIYFQ